MNAPGKAVFLSYASQDADAVRRVAETLRAAGVEVWFDQQELRGGDAWDQKIRRQIRDCTLFLPVISANTQGRPEGYFRREWKFAVERTHDMAEGMPFLLPLVLDGVPEREALVPDVFRTVQWTPVGARGVGAEFAAHVQALLGGGGAAVPARAVPGAVGAGGAGAAQAVPAKREPLLPGWARGAVVVGGVGLGLFFTVSGYLDRRARAKPPGAPKQATPPAAKAEPAKAAAPVTPAMPALDPRRLVLARFENLSGDPGLDAAARILESELVRGLSIVQTARVVPTEVSGRKAALTAAREACAAAAIAGSYVKNGDTLEVSAEILLTAGGELFGSAGPAAVPAAGLRGPALTELIERLATGVNNVSAQLQFPPTRMSAMTYARPWPRWPTAQQARTAQATAAENPDAAIETLRGLVAAAPELLKVKHDLARLLRDQGRTDEAVKLFRELLTANRPQLSEVEIYQITYDESLLTGDPERALQAAKSLLEIRPVSDAITQVVSCLWGQNRPRAAFEALDGWWRAHGPTLPENSRFMPEAGLLATKAQTQVREGQGEAALATLRELRALAAGRPFPSLHGLEFYTYALLGRSDAQEAVLAELTAMSGTPWMSPVQLQWWGYCLDLHAGRPEGARRWLDRAQRTLADTPREGPAADAVASVSIWLHETGGRLDEALRVLETAERKTPGHVNGVGARAVLLTALGRSAEAAELVKKLEAWDPRNSRGLPAYWRARLASRAGDKARAVELLRAAVARGLWFGDFQSSTSEYGRIEPEFAALRGYEPYEQLLKPKG